MNELKAKLYDMIQELKSKDGEVERITNLYLEYLASTETLRITLQLRDTEISQLNELISKRNKEIDTLKLSVTAQRQALESLQKKEPRIYVMGSIKDIIVGEKDLHTYMGWKMRGYYVKPGQRARCYNSEGYALFALNQVARSNYAE